MVKFENEYQFGKKSLFNKMWIDSLVDSLAVEINSNQIRPKHHNLNPSTTSTTFLVLGGMKRQHEAAVEVVVSG